MRNVREIETPDVGIAKEIAIAIVTGKGKETETVRGIVTGKETETGPAIATVIVTVTAAVIENGLVVTELNLPSTVTTHRDTIPDVSNEAVKTRYVIKTEQETNPLHHQPRLLNRRKTLIR